MSDAGTIEQEGSMPRRGIAVFDREHPVKVATVPHGKVQIDTIRSRDLQMGGLGSLCLFFDRFRSDGDAKIEGDIKENDTGFTVDKKGRIQEGNLLNMYRSGLFDITAFGEAQYKDIHETAPPVDFLLWIDGTSQVIRSEIDIDPESGLEGSGTSLFAGMFEPDGEFKGRHWNHFMLPIDVLPKLRVAVEAKIKHGEGGEVNL